METTNKLNYNELNYLLDRLPSSWKEVEFKEEIMKLRKKLLNQLTETIN